MKKTFENREESVEQLIHNLEDGVATPEQRERLMELMRDSPEVVDLYLRHMKMVALLKMAASSRAEIGMMPVSQDMLRHDKRKSGIISMALGVAAVLFLSLGFLFFQLNRQVGDADDFLVVLDRSADSILSISSPNKDLTDADFGGNQLRVGDQVSLSQGVVRFTFPNGVKAIVEGPAEVDVLSEVSLGMKSGKAWFRVPKEGHGFTVESAQVKVIDLGTEFGVYHDKEKKFQVHVGKGRVRVEPRLKSLAKHELVGGEAMRFDVYGLGEEMNVKTSMFQRKFIVGIPYLHWSFDELDGLAFASEGTMTSSSHEWRAVVQRLSKGSEPLNFRNAVTRGKFGKAFSMNGKDWFAQTAFPGIGGDSPRTFAAWVRHRADYGMPRTPYCSWGRRLGYGKSWKVHIWTQDGYALWSSAFKPAAYSPLPKSTFDEWVHIVSVFTGKYNDEGYPEIRHYVNGELQEMLVLPGDKGPIDTDISEASTRLRFGAAYDVDDGGYTVDGDIDEAYLFRGVLNEKQIRQLMRENRLHFFVR